MRWCDLENPKGPKIKYGNFYFLFRSSMIKLSVDFRNAREMKLKEENTSSVSIIKNNKKCFRNIYAPHGAKFRFLFSVKQHMYEASNQGVKIYKVDITLGSKE